MLVNKDVQYGILVALYLARSGRSVTTVMAENLNLDIKVLKTVMGALVLGGVLKLIKGEYELNENPTAQDVVNCFNTVSIIDKKDYKKYQLGRTEHRAFGNFVTMIKDSVNPIFAKTIREISNDLIMSELKYLDKVEVNVEKAN